MNWDDGAGRFFNPEPTISAVSLPGGNEALVVDDVLLDPDGLVQWALRQDFRPPEGFPYPGLILPGPAGLSARLVDWFAQRARTRLGARRTLEHDVRLSMVTTPPSQLEPCQWQCHRDRVSTDPAVLYVGSVLYLFRDPAMGGTSFYVPRRSPEVTDLILFESQVLGAEAFTARYGMRAGYMAGSNAWFECVASVPAAWNRMILYDAGIFHSGDIGRPERLSADPLTARLSLNGFFVCRRRAG
jgi:hypothetical protein